MTFKHPATQILVSTALLTMLSMAVVQEGAYKEPYTNFYIYDAVTQVGISTLLLSLWGYLCFHTVRVIYSNRAGRGTLVFVAWAVMVCFYLLNCPLGYLGDMADISHAVMK